MSPNKDNGQRRSLLGNNGGFTRLGAGAGSDATVNIPLSKVPTDNGQAYSTSTNEKAGFFKGKAHRRQRRPSTPKHHELNAMGRLYSKIFNFSIVTRYLFLSFPLGLLIAVPIVLGATIFSGSNGGHLETADGVPIVWVFTWVEVVWIALWASKIFAKVLPRIFQFLAGAISPGVKKYSLAIRRLEIPISLVGWAVTALATFIPVRDLPCHVLSY